MKYFEIQIISKDQSKDIENKIIDIFSDVLIDFTITKSKYFLNTKPLQFMYKLNFYMPEMVFDIMFNDKINNAIKKVKKDLDLYCVCIETNCHYTLLK